MSEKPVPVVTVIIPAFNAERTLRRTLESAAEQSWPNLEILIVDDGSTDRTADIASAFCATDTRARLIRQANAGEAAARNRAISEASGEWMAPLDADDVWHREKIERQMMIARRNWDAGLIYSWSRLIDADDHVIRNAPRAEHEGEVLTEHLQMNFIGNGSTPLISMRALGNLRYNQNFDACADYLLQVELAMRTGFGVVPAYLTGYRITTDSVSSDALRMIRGHVRMFELLVSCLRGADRRIAERQLSLWRARLGLVLLRRGKMIEGSLAVVGGLQPSPTVAIGEIIHQVARAGRRPPRNGSSGRPFFDFRPEESL